MSIQDYIFTVIYKKYRTNILDFLQSLKFAGIFEVDDNADCLRLFDIESEK